VSELYTRASCGIQDHAATLTNTLLNVLSDHIVAAALRDPEFRARLEAKVREELLAAMHDVVREVYDTTQG
jgi:hypothetical protein